jgi:hypothetical protein
MNPKAAKKPRLLRGGRRRVGDEKTILTSPESASAAALKMGVVL